MMYKEMKILLADMLERGVISESNSPWAAPVVMVKKKDGSWRFCVDYRKLNAITHKDAFPLPRIEEILTTLNRAEWFSTLDLASGYWQVGVHPDDRPKTAFTTPLGLFEFQRMPFGLCNGPATFQRLMFEQLHCRLPVDLFGRCYCVFGRFRHSSLSLGAGVPADVTVRIEVEAGQVSVSSTTSEVPGACSKQDRYKPRSR